MTEDPVVVVVEGFLIFAEPSLVDVCTHLVEIGLDGRTGAIRRCRRERGDPTAVPDDRYLRFCRHIYSHHMEIREQMSQNASQRAAALGRRLISVDGASPQEEVLRTVLDELHRSLDRQALP